MIIHVFVKLNDILKLGRDYPWQKPETCPKCNRYKVWGHGYVRAFFDGFNDAFLIKRYRCPDCKCVMRMRPRGYFSRFQAPIETIRASIFNRLKSGKWLSNLSRTRQAHWLRSFKRRVFAYFGGAKAIGLDEAFDHFVAQGVTPVSRSI